MVERETSQATEATGATGATRARRPAGQWVSPERSAVGACTKYSLFFINFIFLIVGLAMTALSTYILVLKEKRLTYAILFFMDPACDTCLVGALITVLCFLGSWGALREITCFLKTYHFALFILLFAEIFLSTSMLIAHHYAEAKEHVFPKEAFRLAIKNYRDDPDMQYLIDAMQQELDCCGYSDSEEGYRDWNGNMYFNCSKSNLSAERCSVPYSCCIRRAGERINYQCGHNVETLKADGTWEPNLSVLMGINSQGCIRALGNLIVENSLMICGIASGIIIPQLLILLLSSNLIRMITIQKNKWH
ncbi:hypothetical protein EGW08_001263 [Elysia chlorotica]|uniref:Tetraspanin n=1 Tax=Elysia chlorotica TaxID=188477 RepID=A0A433UAW4_ELYCH|nr:hypothetical protein EGW08_001263 [Elysia chlorotica]